MWVGYDLALPNQLPAIGVAGMSLAPHPCAPPLSPRLQNTGCITSISSPFFFVAANICYLLGKMNLAYQHGPF